VAKYLKRLGRALAAYQIADVVSKVIAIALLPVYTRYIHPAGYGIVELIANGVIFVSIVIRFGMIEAFIRFYYSDEDRDRRDALARRATLFLLVATTLAALVAIAAARPLSHLALGHTDVPTFLIGVLGLWTFTNLELAYGLLRVDERVRAYAAATVTNVIVTVITSVILVVAVGMGARGLLLANYGTSTAVLLVLWWTSRRRLARAGRRPAEALPALLRFGLPTVPAEASVYALSVVDRYFLLYHSGRAAVGLYSIAVKLAGGIAFVVRAFQYAWPPLAYSVTDDAQASRLYGLVATYYVLGTGLAVSGLALFGRWIIKLLTAPSFYGSYRALPWLALGWALYGLFVILVVISGRAKATTRNFPAALTGLAANIVLLVLLVPPLGIAGAGIALCGAYAVMLAVMHALTRNLFTVAFEWRRLGLIVAVMGLLGGGGDALLPAHGLGGLAARACAFAANPAVLHLLNFAHKEELGRLRAIVAGAARRGAPA
jgi:O-antigen/teichoic acid export membrane protein